MITNGVLEVMLKGTAVNCFNARLNVTSRPVFTVPCPGCYWILS